MRPLTTLSALFAAASALSHNVLLLGAGGKDSETVTIGDLVFELTTDASITAGRIAVDLSGSSAAAAVGTLTTTGNAVAAETVTIGAVTYTWAASVTTTANTVKVGADATESLNNLVAAIMAGAGSGTVYGSATVVHPTVTAVRSSATLVATAKVKGTAGNALASTETMTNASWGASTLASGADATATQTRDAIVLAINLNVLNAHATAITGGVLFVDSRGRGPVATTETLTGSGNAWVNTTTFGADYGGTIPNIVAMIQRTVTTVEATAGVMVFALPAAPVAFSIEVRTTAGVKKAWDGVAAIVGNSIILDNSGSTDLANSDVVVVSFAV